MRRLLTVGLVLTALPGLALAGPIKLTDVQMDGVTAGNLVLPNNKIIMSGFDVPAPGAFHPNFNRNQAAQDATQGIPPSGDPADGFGGNNEGPWSAHFVSPVIGCNEAPC